MSRRSFLLLLVYLSVPLALVSLELALRLRAPGLENPLVREVRHDGIEWFEINRSYLARYFPPGSPLVPEFRPGIFIRKEKQKNTLRIFCLGSSTMFGTPYQMTANIPGLLRKQLRRRYPDREIEVVNFGASAINSNVVRHLSGEAATLKPDMVLVYLGHNEFYGPDGVGAGLVERMIPRAIQWKYALRGSRLLSWLLGLISSAPRPGEGERNLMREVSRGGAVPLDSPDAQRVFTLFEDNLRAILEFWNHTGTPVIVSDVSSNLRFHPFLYDTTALSPALLRLHAARDLNGVETGAIDADLARLISLYPDNAFGRFWAGQRALVRGDTATARTELMLARDHDLLKFRAPDRINAILRAVCKSAGTPLLPADSFLSSLSPGGITGDALFWEHLHPTLEGYCQIASLFFAEIEKGMQARGDGVVLSPSRIPCQSDSLSVCWLDLAYGDLSIGHLTGRWPFTHYRRAPAVLGSAAPELAAVARSVYERRITWDEGCYESAMLFWKRGELGAAATTYEALLEEYPFNYYPRYLLGNLLAKWGKSAAALVQLQRSVSSNPGYPNSRLDLGLLLINEGRFDDALAQLREAARLPSAQQSPELLSTIRYGIGAALANRGEFAAALRELETSLSLNPANADAARLKRALESGP